MKYFMFYHFSYLIVAPVVVVVVASSPVVVVASPVVVIGPWVVVGALPVPAVGRPGAGPASPWAPGVRASPGGAPGPGPGP